MSPMIESNTILRTEVQEAALAQVEQCAEAMQTALDLCKEVGVPVRILNSGHEASMIDGEKIQLWISHSFAAGDPTFIRATSGGDA